MSGVAVVGSISVDLTAYGSPLPRPGETVIADSFTMVLGGKGANQALAAVRAGAATFMVGAVGDDLFRGLVLGTLVDEGVDTGAVQVVDGSTGVAHIRVDTASGENNIAIIGNANFRLTPDRAEAELRGLADRVSVVLVQLEAPLESVVRIAEVCRGLGLSLVLDPAPARELPDAVWAGVAVVTPNETEAEILTGVSVVDADSAERAAAWFLDRGVDTVVITLAERGAMVVRAGSVEELPAHRVEAVDSTAAGDAFAGALGAGMAAGLSQADAVRRALAAGALAVTVRGASPSLPTAAAVDAFLAERAS